MHALLLLLLRFVAVISALARVSRVLPIAPTELEEATRLLQLDATRWTRAGFRAFETIPWAVALGGDPSNVIGSSGPNELNPSQLLARRDARLLLGESANSATNFSIALRAYHRIAKSWAGVPPHERNYLFAQTTNGWGNRNRLFSFALTLAIATKRLLVFDSSSSEPFYPHSFLRPRRVQFTRLESLVAHVRSAHAKAVFTRVHKNSTALRWYLRNETRSKVVRLSLAQKHSGVMGCWIKNKSLSACGVSDSSTRVLRIDGVFDRSGWIASSPELLSSLDASVRDACAARARTVVRRIVAQLGHQDAPDDDDDGSGTSSGSVTGDVAIGDVSSSHRQLLSACTRVCRAHTKVLWRMHAASALFGARSTRLARSIAAEKTRLGWGSFRLIVAIHFRAFVDVKGAQSAVNRSTAFWTCAQRRIQEAQRVIFSASSSSPSLSLDQQQQQRDAANQTLLFFASDTPLARDIAGQHLGRHGVLRSTESTRNFQHSNSRKHVNPIHASVVTLTEWSLIADADIVIGSWATSFSGTASQSQGTPHVFAGTPTGGRSSSANMDLECAVYRGASSPLLYSPYGTGI